MGGRYLYVRGRACSDNRNKRRCPQVSATVAAVFRGFYVAAGDVSGGTPRHTYVTYIESFCRITNLSEQRSTSTRIGTHLAPSFLRLWRFRAGSPFRGSP